MDVFENPTRNAWANGEMIQTSGEYKMVRH